MCHFILRPLFQKSILISTMNDDPETLEAILNWGKEKGMCRWSPNHVEENPILLASLEGYTECMKHLYKAGNRIHLFDEDWESVRTQNNHGLKTVTYGQKVSRKPTMKKKALVAMSSLILRQGNVLESDPVNRYLRFKAFANPNYLSLKLIHKDSEASLTQVDPLRLAFALSSHASLLAEFFPEHSTEYLKIKNRCEEYATDILAHCHNTKDVDSLLEYIPEECEGEVDCESNWDMALWGDHKTFVSHAYYQHFTWKKVRGTEFDPYNYNILGRLLAIPFAIIMFWVSIPTILADCFFRDGCLLFNSPRDFTTKQNRKQLQDGSSTEGNESHYHKSTFKFEGPFWSFVRERLHRPIFRMYISAFWEVIFLIILCASMTQANDGKLEYSFVDLTLWTFVAHYFFEDIVDLVIRKWDFLFSFWSCYTLFTNALIVIGGVIYCLGERKTDYRATLPGNHPVNIGLTMFAYGATMHCLRTLRWFLLDRSIGPVVVCFIRVLRDVVYVFVVFIVIYFSFALGIWFMYKPFTSSGGGASGSIGDYQCTGNYCIGDDDLKHNPGIRAVLSKMFWRVFDGDATDSMVQTKEEYGNGKNSTAVFSLEFSHFMGYTMWAIYQGLTAILLINILIAQMNSTYLRVWENVDTEWKYSKSFYQVC